jgi:hypothetical protein
VPSALIIQIVPGLAVVGARSIYAMWPRYGDALGVDEAVGVTPDAWGCGSAPETDSGRRGNCMRWQATRPSREHRQSGRASNPSVPPESRSELPPNWKVVSRRVTPCRKEPERCSGLPSHPFYSRLDWPQVERSEAEAIVRRDLPTCIEEILALMPIEPPADDFRHRLYEEMFQPSVAGILDGTVLLVDGRMTMKVVASAQSGPNPKAN